ncbi:histamine H2 receptor-like [Heptranchias perlo]|uniref:histamine H2 receptor-like n=1 Tax=Heptranchias perlo TaxID=212740 RepID=UPI00355A36D7
MLKMWLETNLSALSNHSVPWSLAVREGNSSVWIAPQDVMVGVLLTVIDLVTFLGNAVVFICPAVEKRLRTVTYMFIMSLAMADLLLACLVMPFSIIYEVTGMWMFGRLFCKVWISFDVMFCTASIVTLCFISLDRYCSVVTPYHYPKRMSRRRRESEAVGKPPSFNCQRDFRIQDARMHIGASVGNSEVGGLEPGSEPERDFHNFRSTLAPQRTRNFPGKSSPCNRGMSQICGLKDHGILGVGKQQIPGRGPFQSLTCDEDAHSSQACFAKLRAPSLQYSNARLLQARYLVTCEDTEILPCCLDFLESCGCIIMAVTIWVYSSLISFLPVMQGWNEIPGVDFDTGTECIFVTNWTFAIVASALAFYIPFLIMCSMYFFIYRASRLKATRIASQTLNLHYHPNSKRPNNLQLENKATRTMSIIISAFVMCWLPYFVLNVWLAVHGSETTSSVITYIFKVITWLGYCNSTINPMLYAFLNRDFQRALKKLLICRRWSSQVDIGEDMVSIVTFSKTAQEAEYNTRVISIPNGNKRKPKQ